MNMMRAIKSGLRDIVAHMLRLLPQPRDSAVILAYHSISESGSVFAVSPRVFESQMEWLKKNKYNVVSLDQLATYRTAGTIPPKTIAITFDDGYRDNYFAALPILQHFNFPATVFVITSRIGGSWKLGQEDVPLMSEEELRDLRASELFTIGAHTATHPRLPQVDSTRVAQELSESNRAIESRFGSCAHFAYPHGRFTKEIRDAVARAGFSHAYTVAGSAVTPESDNYLLSRVEVAGTTTLTQFKAIATHGHWRVPFSSIRM
jgi:peptidoglycan/xylan/chitin deacetylase (PgdA/CDA1 family)